MYRVNVTWNDGLVTHKNFSNRQEARRFRERMSRVGNVVSASSPIDMRDDRDKCVEPRTITLR